MGKLSKLEPAVVWQQFENICEVPRPSKREDKIIAFLENFAKANNIEYKKDKVGNILMKKPAAKGFENKDSVVLQSHIDMVCEKNEDKVHDFYNDPITPIIDGDWVRADNTTLGADDGIGVAAQLAVLISDDIKHGPLECLFTIDEETGLTGAMNIQDGFFESKILLNLDSEDDGEIFIGCAGGIDTIASFDLEQEKIPNGYFAASIKVSGLQGGHSGDDIEKGRGNANKILNRFLWNEARNINLRVCNIDGGNLRNAIAREAKAVIVVPAKYKEQLRVDFNIFTSNVANELEVNEPGVDFHLESCDIPEKMYTESFQNVLLNAIYACPHGVIAMSHKISGVVETSTNLASIKQDKEKIVITTSQRSLIDSAKDDVAAMVYSVFELFGAKIKQEDGYPGWAPNTNSKIMALARDSYIKLFNQKPEVRVIHAGLECGLFLEKYPNLDMVSIGPTIRGAHSPVEKIEIKTVDKFWKHLLDILENV